MRVGRRWWALGAAVIVVAAFVVLGMTSPRTVPRLAFLPAPASRHWKDDCNTVAETWERHGIVWKREYFSTAVGCLQTRAQG
jgi:hypothetical protein